jgi:hypothetical protein
MHPRLAEARKVEAMEAIPTRLDRIEAKLDALLARKDEEDSDAARMTKAAFIGKPATTFTQPPAKGR